jgi:hypothetical protein
LRQKALSPGRRVQLRRNSELLGAGHAKLAQRFNRRDGSEPVKGDDQALSRLEPLIQDQPAQLRDRG